ncbi:MAG: hypothetical protein ABI434_19900 [Burkholderiaceae bacterium]
MTKKKISVDSARSFVAGASILGTTRDAVAAGAVQLALDSTKNQATVVGSGVVSFVSGVTTERRQAIINSSLLAQLVARKKVPDPENIKDWYAAYFDTLTNIGWVVQDTGFAKYQESSENFDAHKAILTVAATLLGPASTALAIVTSTLNALQSMNESSPWITIFNRESQIAKSARFQVGIAEQDAEGQFFVNLMAFVLDAKSSVTQVLFFKAKKNQVNLEQYSARVTINSAVLEGVREAIAKKLVNHSSNFISGLPDLD